ncbi:MAG: hypothetical protein DA407_15040 [Bacteroidetes bacterium]|nr:MAG: hypothetical protein DA407_15040 [Bacteroidota bacterium]
MKNLKLSTNLLLLLVVFALTFTGCSKNDSDEQESSSQDYSEVALSSEIDRASDAMDDFAIQVFEAQEEVEPGSPNNGDTTTRDMNDIPDCVTITLVAEGTSREITIDFGAEGCLVNGNVFKGKIILSYERIPEAQQVTIIKTLEDFYFNNKNIVGGKTIIKVLSNENGNPQFTKTTDITVIWPNGAQASRNGVKVREWIEGFGSGVWSDNVFEITGNWTSMFVNGSTHSYEVVIPLRREVVCYYFVSGSIDVERTNFSGMFDYGSGNCDNQATFTFDGGTVVDITLN